ncbi:MAG TPA: TonB-dependent receptor [Caulobacteraceae bacterium]
MDQTTLGEVVVTAEKRQELLSKAPLSLAVVTGAQAMRQGMTQVDQVLATVGGVKVLEGQDGPTFYIRGIGTGVPSSVGDPEVNLNIDGVYQSEPEFTRAGLYDVARVEVLRGPQGTLYGRNALAGAVNIVTNDPTFDYGASASVGFGNYSLIQAQGMVNVPVNDQLAVRVAAGSENHKGYLTNGADDAVIQSVRVKLLWKPTDRLKIVLAADDTHEGGEGEGEIQVSPPPPGFPIPTNSLGNVIDSSNPWTSPDPGTAVRHTNFWSTHAQIDADLGFGVLSFLPAYRSYSYQCLSCFRSETDQNNYASERQTTAELRLASPAASSFKWLVGLYYLNANNPSFGQQLGPGADSFSDSSGNSVSEQGQNSFRSISYAVFGQATYPITTQLRLTAGARYTVDRKSETAFVSSETGGVTTVTTGLFSASKRWNAFTYRAGVEYDLTPHSLLYANVSTGYKAGGFYQGAAPNSYDPEHLTAYEIGSKNRLLNDRLEINADFFYYDYSQYQVNYLSFINPTSAGIFGILTANAAGATSYGAEIEVRYLPTSHDEFDVSLYPLHARFKSLVIGGLFGGDYTGLVLPFAPTFSANLGYQHAWALSNQGRLTARAETHLEAGSWVTFSQAPHTHQPSYSLSNVYLTYDSPDRKWSVAAYVKNLENQPVLVNAQGGPAGLEAADIGPPRTFGVQLTASF